MIATKYTQAVTVKMSLAKKFLLYGGAAIEIASLALLIVGIFVNLYVLFAFIALAGIGVLLCQLYYAQTIEYNYHFSDDAIVFTKKDVRLRVTTLLTVKFDRVQSFELFSDFADKKDKVYLENLSKEGNKVLIFQTLDGTERVIFSPDDYLNALICDILGKEEI